MKKLICIAAMGATVLIIILLATHQPYNRANLDAKDMSAMTETVRHYYTALEGQNYKEALSYCEIDKKHNDLHMTVTTRIACLQELRNHLISSFKFTKIVSNALNNSAVIQYDNSEKAYGLIVAYQISYVDSPGGIINENVYLKKIGEKWKIVSLQSVDPYAGFRVGSYRYVEGTGLLTS